MNVNEGPDSLQVYLTGAATPGGAQLDAAASLGGYRSVQRALPLMVHRVSALPHTVIEWASGLNGSGLGRLAAAGDNALRWTAPGGTPGEAVTIANGERAVLRDGTTAGAYVIARRISPYELGGAEQVQLLPYVGNVAGMGDFDWPAHGTHGDTHHYRAVMLRNAAGSTITDMRMWAETADSKCAFRAETPDAQGALTAIPDEDTNPGGGFFMAATEAGSLQLAASLAPGAETGVWLRKSVTGYSYPDPLYFGRWWWKWTIDGVTYYGKLEGANWVEIQQYPYYLIWGNAGSPPDSENTAPDFTRFGLPYEIPVDLPGPETYYFHVRKRNTYWLVGPPREIVVRVDDGDEEVGEPPSGPSAVTIEARPEGKMQISALYLPRSEGESESEISERRADEWVVYVSAGAEPNPETDTPVTETMRGGMRREQLSYMPDEDFLEGTPVYVLVRTRRNDKPDPTEEIPEPLDEWVYSENTEVYSAAAEWWGPGRPLGAASLGRTIGLRQSPVTPPDETVVVDAEKDVYWEVTGRGTRLYANGALVWVLRYEGPGHAENGLFTTFGMKQETISGAAGALVEIGEWDEGAKEIFVSCGGERRLKIDVEAETVSCARWTQMDAPAATAADVPVWERWEETDFQSWDATREDYVTGMALTNDGLRLAVDWKQRATAAECL